MLQRRTAANGVTFYASPLFEAAEIPHAFSTRLGGVSTGELEHLPKIPSVQLALLIRADAPMDKRMESLAALAKQRNITQMNLLIEVLEPLAAKGGKTAEDLSKMAGT